MAAARNIPWTPLGVVGVDGGMVLLIDPCYLRDPQTAPEIRRAVDAMCENPPDVDAQQLYYPLGHPGLGLLCFTGVGDGLYQVAARLVDLGQGDIHIAELRMRFIDMDEDEDDANTKGDRA